MEARCGADAEAPGNLSAVLTRLLRMSNKLIAINDAAWQATVLDRDGPLVVAFYAPDSSPCRVFGPTLEALSQKLAGRAVVLKIDVRADPATARRYEVTALPTMLVFRQGRVVGRIVGAASQKRVLERLLPLLA